MIRSKILVKTILVFCFTVLGFLVMGYHPGIEDDGIYLAAIKSDIRPTLFPHDSDFFRLQLQATVFDRWVASFVSITHISVPWAELLWQFLSLFFILWAAHSIAQQLFSEPSAQWAGVATLAAMFTLPVAGTALYVADQHLHPRNMATALILLAVDRILERKAWQAIPFLFLALIFHPIMAAMGISFSFFLTIVMLEPAPAWLRSLRGSAAAFMPLGWIFEAPSTTWRQALSTRTYYFIYQWAWYEWLGALAPLLLFGLLWRLARSRGQSLVARFSLALVVYGVVQQSVAFAMLTPPAFVRLTPLQPMRYLQLIYLFMALVGGCLLGKYVLKTRIWRWGVFLVAASVGMLAPQRVMFADSNHLELPGRATGNAWLQAFAWIRQNTPEDAYFALDPNYLADPGEDYHSFRALGERSQLADALKDTAVVTQVPQLGPEWARELKAQAGWRNFKLADFERLKLEFGVDWTLVNFPPPEGLDCRWHNAMLSVCRIR